ncbi:hypothetical protein VYU27_005502 [Nannochloropsis oceanica]
MSLPPNHHLQEFSPLQTATISPSSPRLILVKHRQAIHRVGIYPGLSALELSKLLTAAFKLGGLASPSHHATAPPSFAMPAVVGFQDEATGVIFPISLACSSGLPVGAGVCYRLLLTGSEDFLCPSPIFLDSQYHHHHQQQQQQQQQQHLHPQRDQYCNPTLSPRQADQASFPVPPPAIGAKTVKKRAKAPIGTTPVTTITTKEGNTSYHSAVTNASNNKTRTELGGTPRRNKKLHRFISNLLSRKILPYEEAQVLFSLLNANHLVVCAAYRVAQHRRQDKELLTSLMRNIAQVILGEGQTRKYGEEEGDEEGSSLTTLEVMEDMLVALDLFRHKPSPFYSSSPSSSYPFSSSSSAKHQQLQQQPLQLTTTQLVTLEHMIITQEERVYEVFRLRSETGDEEAFVGELRALAEGIRETSRPARGGKGKWEEMCRPATAPAKVKMGEMCSGSGRTKEEGEQSVAADTAPTSSTSTNRVKNSSSIQLGALPSQHSHSTHDAHGPQLRTHLKSNNKSSSSSSMKQYQQHYHHEHHHHHHQRQDTGKNEEERRHRGTTTTATRNSRNVSSTNATTTNSNGSSSSIKVSFPPPPPPPPVPPPRPRRKPLESIIRSLEKSVKLRPIFIEWLLRRYRAGDEYVEAAYENYRLDGDEEELIDSLRRLLKVRVEGMKMRQKRQQQQGGSDGGVPEEVTSAIVKAVESGTLTEDQGKMLENLYVGGHEVVRSAWEIYRREKDGRQLVERWKRIARIVAAAEGKSSDRRRVGRGGERGGRGGGGRAGADAKRKEANEGARLSARQAIIKQSLELLVARRKVQVPGIRLLTHLFESGDTLLKETLDIFLQDQDVEGLLGRLLRILEEGDVSSAPPACVTSVSSPFISSNQSFSTPPPAAIPRTHQIPAMLSPLTVSEADTIKKKEGMKKEMEEEEEEEVDEMRSFVSDKANKSFAPSLALNDSLLTQDNDP